MRRSFFPAVFFLIIMGAAIPALAAPVTMEIPFVGKLPLSVPATYTLRYSLWDEAAPGAGSMVWSEEENLRLTSKTIRQNLGSIEPLDEVDFAQQLWVQVDRWKAKTSEWVPVGARVMLQVVPYALYSETVGAYLVTSAEIVDGTVTAADLEDGAALAEIADDDGSGSGLDADLVDGLHASEIVAAGHGHTQYVLTAGDTMTGALVLDTGTEEDLSLNEEGVSRSGSVTIDAFDAAAATTVSVLNSDETQVADLSVEGEVSAASFVGDGSGLTNIGAGLAGVELDAAYVNEGQAESVTGGMIVDGTVTAADLEDGAALAEIADDDGSGSGLDADLLDGSHAAAFAAISHSHAGDDITSGTVAEAWFDAAIARDSEIVPAVLASDGAGSGLDADLLDGADSSAFAATGHDHTTAYYSKAYVDALESRIAALETILAGVTRVVNDIYITGANLHIRSGSGTTAGTVNGKGNLIVGYDEPATVSDKSGSHNIVVGSKHNYVSYGGLVAGFNNTVSGQYASVSGGAGSTASGNNSSVSGGWANTASGYGATVGGGTRNIASGKFSTVSGGGQEIMGLVGNEAFADYSSILGGRMNTTGDGVDRNVGTFSVVSGGESNIALGNSSSVSGGVFNKARNYWATVTGGSWNAADGSYSAVTGGRNNIASGGWASVSGGGGPDAIDGNEAAAAYSSILGGRRNNTSGANQSTIAGGHENNATGLASSVTGGYYNTASGDYSSVTGGGGNEASASKATVSGGDSNLASGSQSTVSGGYSHTSSAQYDWRAGGLFQDQ